jgi:hypothetical protein
MMQLGPYVYYIPSRRKHVFILVASVRLNPYLIGSLYPAPGARSPLRIRQSSRMVGPLVIVSSILLVTSADAGRRVETLF